MIEIVVRGDRRHDAEFPRKDKATEYVRRLVRMGFDLNDIEVQEDGIELDPVEDLGVRMASLRSSLIRLAHTKPELRSTLLPLLGKKASVKVDDALEIGNFPKGKNWMSISSDIIEALSPKQTKAILREVSTNGGQAEHRTFYRGLEKVLDTEKTLALIESAKKK